MTSSAPKKEKDNKSFRLSTVLWDVTFILAVATGLMFMCGYVHFEALYTRLHVPFHVFELGADRLIMYGSFQVFVWIGGFGAIAFLIGFGEKKPDREKPNTRWNRFLLFLDTRRYPRLLAGGTIVIAFILWVTMLISVSNNQGRRAAEAFLNGDCWHFEVITISNESLLGCLVNIRNEVYWLRPIDKSKKLVIVENTLIIPQNDIKSVKIVPRITQPSQQQ